MLSLKDQLQTFKNFLRNSKLGVDSPVFGKAMEFLRLISSSGEVPDAELRDMKLLIQQSFSLADEDLAYAIAQIQPKPVEKEMKGDPTLIAKEKELWNLIPSQGLMYDYCKYTEKNEAPLAYHLFCGILGVGAVVNRRVWYDMAFYRLFPALGIILLGPSGIKKTSAANVIVSIVAESDLTPLYSEKITPEALALAMSKIATGLIYAPELSVFLGKQKYMEGVIPFLTRVMDHPDIFPTETKGGGKIIVREVGASLLGCSTLDWFVSNTPEDTFGGGFIARNILVAQDDSPRCFSRPIVEDTNLRVNILKQLGDIWSITGEMEMRQETFRRYDLWYNSNREKWKHPEVELLTSYYQRKADHIKRIAMILHLSQCRDLHMCVECFDRAVEIMEWLEQFLTPMFKRMFKTTSGMDIDFVIKNIRSKGGLITHTSLVRAVQYRMSATQLRGVLNSLKESNQVTEIQDKLQHIWVLND